MPRFVASKRLRLVFFTGITIIFLCVAVFFKFRIIHAQTFPPTGGGSDSFSDPLTGASPIWTPPGGAGYPVYDTATERKLLEQLQQAQEEAERNWLKEAKDFAKKKGAYEIIKSATQNFVQTMAYETASKIAQGGPGQQTLGWDMPWDTYLKDAAGAAIGDFLGNLSDVVGVNFCDPGKLGKLDFALGLIEQVAKPPKPRCDWQDIKTSWQNMDEGEFTKKLAWSFNPNVNYLGTNFALQEELQNQIQERKTLAQLTRGIKSEKMKDVTDEISGWTKTPSFLVADMAEYPFQAASDKFLSDTFGDYIMGGIVTPAFTTFFSTLSGKLMQKWMTKGLFPSNAYDASKNFGWLDSSNGRGTNAISNQSLKDSYSDFMRPHFDPGGNQDILSELAACPYPANPGPTNCVIESNFRAAIAQNMTVGTALIDGHLMKNGIFGFTNAGKEPNYNGEGYPLRSIKILRRYRVLPVGWEIAAEYINKFAANKPYTLQQMVDCYDPADEWNETNTKEEWCRGLVDPDWLLKVPAYMCEKEGYGQEIVSEQFINGRDVNGNGSYLDQGVDGTAGDVIPTRSISRNKFCVASKSCIKESRDGKCLKWGDCLEEKRIWRFSGESCEEQFNTCQSFEDKDGKNVSYVRNTLNYSGCDSSNAGCGWYCQDYDYVKNNWTCGIKKSADNDFVINGSRVFLNKFAQTCDADSEGCHEFINLQSGVNLIYNGELEFGIDNEYASGKFNFWPVKNGSGALKITKNIDSEKGGYVYEFETAATGGGIFSYDGVDVAKQEKSMMPDGYSFDISKSYILSADVKVEEGEIELGIGSDITNQWERTIVSAAPGQWKRAAAVFSADEFLANEIFIGSHKLSDAGKTKFTIDNIKLEEAVFGQETVPSFKSYNSKDSLTYLKKAPSYLSCAIPGAGVINPQECANFAAECEEEEAGCSKYSPINGDPWMPGIVSADDKCDLSCVNYKSYKQNATNFSKEIMNVNFIAENRYRNDLGGISCQAQAAGCTEFTNLDKLEQGGEAREYYTDLRRCEKPSNPGTSCGTFYTWTGNDTAGHELKTYYLKKDGAGNPVVVPNPMDLGKCANVEDTKTNPNCKEFYNEAGATFYAIYQNTVTCSEDCHPYKRTREKINQSACLIYESKWVGNKDVKEIKGLAEMADSANDGICKLEVENCLYSGGEWKNTECIYDAVPGEGLICSSQSVGCNEYVGTTGSNVKNVLPADDFENRTNSGWQNGLSSNEATIAGGQSLTVNQGSAVIAKDINAAGGKLNKNKTYSISFLASNKGQTKDLEVILKAKDFFNKNNISIQSGTWREYKIGSIYLGGDLDENGLIDNADLAILQTAKESPMNVTARQRDLADINNDGKINQNDIDILTGEKDGLKNLMVQYAEIRGMDSNIFLDNILIKEVQENIYRIKDSWTVPEECDAPIAGAQLGCSEYRDINNRVVQLKSLKLCPTEAIGCTRMIDTQNSFSAFQEIYNEGDESSILVPRDKVIYIVNDSSKECLKTGEEKGCEKLGVPQINQDKTALAAGAEFRAGDVYLLNNPDKYGSILCDKKGLYCDEFKYTDVLGMEYFKNPGDKICEFDKNSGKWVKKGTKDKCPAEADINKTLGATPGAQIKFPINGWVALCDRSQSNCTEYVDPLSDNEANLVFNGNLEQDAQSLDGGDADGPDGWSDISGCVSDKDKEEPSYCADCCNRGYSGTKGIKNGQEKVALLENSLYTFSARVRGTGNIKISDCTVSSPDKSMEITSDGKIAAKSFKDIFYSDDPLKMDTVNGRFYISKLSENADCMLTINAPEGMADELSIQKTDVYYNISNTLTSEGCEGKVNAAAGCALLDERKFSPSGIIDNNKIFKVQPDRTCGRWISESNTYKADGEDKSSALTECIEDSSNNSCAIPVLEEKKNRDFNEGNVSLLKNISGLSNVGFEWSDGNKIEGYYPLSRMPQIGQYIDFKGGFEDARKIKVSQSGQDYKLKPVGWDVTNRDDISKKIEDWAGKDYFSLIYDPVTAQKEGLEKSAPAGRTFLKLNGDSVLRTTKEFPVYEKTAYAVSGYVDTRKIMSNGKSGIYILFFDNEGNSTGEDIKLEIKENTKWTFLAKNFDTPAMTTNMVIVLKNDEKASGSSYFDEIMLRPALELQKGQIAPSICKVYPQEDSLSCDYEDQNQIFYKGERGYCMEYDRSPGNPENCISWYPIGMVRGEETDEIPPLSFASFGQGPLYYCMDAQFLENRVTSGSESTCNCSGECPSEYYCDPSKRGCTGFRHKYDRSCIPKTTGSIGSDDAINSLFYYDGNLRLYYSSKNFNENFITRCTTVVQVATVEGDSQPWNERLNAKSSYGVPGLTFGALDKNSNYQEQSYSYGSQVYGAIIPPDNTDVSQWDFDTEKNFKQMLSMKGQWDQDGKEPLEFIKMNNAWFLPYAADNMRMRYKTPDCTTVTATDKNRAGAGGACEVDWKLNLEESSNVGGAVIRMENLFARSYGIWQWEESGRDSGYKKIDTLTYSYVKQGEAKKEISCGTNPIGPSTDKITFSWIVRSRNVQGEADECWLAWKWYDYTDLISSEVIKEYRIDNSFVFSGDNVDLNDYKCNGINLAFKMEDILANPNGWQTGVTKEQKKGDDGKCYEYQTNYLKEINQIEEEKISLPSEGCNLRKVTPTSVEVLSSNDSQQIDDGEEIIQRMQKGGDCYEYRIYKNIIPAGGVSTKEIPCTPLYLFEREGEKCYQTELSFETLEDAKWEPPTIVCPDGKRPTCVADKVCKAEFCGVKPKVSNVKVENSAKGNLILGISYDILLQFNTDVDPNQAPLGGYNIDWGDGSKSNDILRFRAQPIAPHFFGHTYSYWDLKQKLAQKTANPKSNDVDSTILQCFGVDKCRKDYDVKNGSNCCIVKPKIQIKDNWGWCNNGISGDSCPANRQNWATYDGWIVLTDK